MITLSFHAFCMTWLFGKFAWKITRFFCNPQNCSLSMDQQKCHDIVYLKLSNENGLWIWKSKIKYEKYISFFSCFFLSQLINLALHWNLSFQPRQFLQFWPFQIVFHPIDSTLQWLLPNLPGTNQKRSCPHKSSPEVLITEIHIYNIVKNKEHANAICNDKCYLQCQFNVHSQNSEAWWPYQIVGLIKDDYVSLYFYTMSFSRLKQ